MGRYEDNLAAWGREADDALAAVTVERDNAVAAATAAQEQNAALVAETQALREQLAACAPEPMNQWVRTTWVLDQLESLTDWQNAKTRGIDQGLATPGVGGVSIRMKWNRIETAPGVYDWSVFDAVRAAYPNVKMSVRFMAGKHTPEWHKGNSYLHGGVKVPKPWDAQGRPGNAAFEYGWGRMVAAITDWSKRNGCRLVHLSQYGFEWAELFNGDEQKAAWRADFGGGEATGTGSRYNSVVVDAHKRLIDICRPLLPEHMAFELPASGYGTTEVAKPIFDYARTKFTGQQLAVQSNCWAGPYNCGRALGVNSGLMFGYQAFALGGPTNQSTASRNTHPWSGAYVTLRDSAAQQFADYTEVYRETFADPTDRTAISTVLATFTYAGSPGL